MRQTEEEPHRSSPATRQRGDVSIADVVTAAARLGATDPADLAAISQALDVTIPIVPAAPPRVPTQVLSPPSQSGSFTTPSTQTALRDRARMTGPPVAARLYQEERTDAIPAWLGAVEALSLAGSGSFGVPHEPPIPAVQARSSIATLAATRRPGRRLDVATLIERSARMQPPAAYFLLELRTSPFVQLLVDRGEGMEPYADDLDFLALEFVQVAGHDRVEQRTFTGTPERGLDPDVFTGETAEWQRPAAKSLVLILTDLGIGGPPASRDRAQADEWRAVAEAVASAQADLRVLTPFPASRLPAELATIMQVVSWDSLAHLVRLRG